MRLISFTADGRSSYGVLQARGVHDLGSRLGPALPDLKSYLAAAAWGRAQAASGDRAVDYAEGEFAYAAVIPNPGKILCVGLNYEEHRQETGRPEAAHPAIFTRFADTLVAHGAPVVLPATSSTLDYEGELAVVVGKGGFRIPEEEAADHIAGYACFNDVTVRDWQRHTHQFTPGKNFPATGPFGPWLATPDELKDLEGRSIETRLAGAVMQRATLGDMIFPVPRILAYVSGFTALSPGDVIATGTPGGVGFKRTPPRYMVAGETVEVEIAGLGVLSNPIVAEAAGP